MSRIRSRLHIPRVAAFLSRGVVAALALTALEARAAEPGVTAPVTAALPASTAPDVTARPVPDPSPAPAPAGRRPRPRLRAVPVAQAPTLDGHVTGDPAWAAAPAASDFTQTSPDDGRPASERTEVRIVYTRAALYVGVICFDGTPGGLVMAEGRRDSSLDQVDSFRVLLDTFGDGQNAFVFGTTPAGAEFDGQVINDGGGSNFTQNAQQGGSLAGFNQNWDAAWEVRTQTGPFGWSAELAIPLRTLRYGSGGTQRWGVNFQRVVQRRNETAYWAPLDRQLNLYRVSEAGALDGLDLPPQRNLKVIPYLLGEARRDYVTQGILDPGANVGGDLKYSFTPSLTLDGTFRTDFAEVEVDEQQLQLDRFNLVFPEKRPFFLENAGLFSAGLPGEIDLFFSRRIGIGPKGQVIPIVGGGRFSGKVGRLRLGLVDMQTEALTDVTPANNFSVARVSYELGNRSSVGAFFGNRQATSGPGWRGDHARTYAADGRVGLGRHGLVSGFVAGTDVPGAAAGPFAYNVSAQYDGPALLLDGRFSHSGAGFDPQIGFLRRHDFRKGEATILYRYRPDDLLGLKELRPHTSGYAYVKPDGFLESRFVHLDNHFEWRNGFELHTGVNFTEEGVREPFEIDPKRMIYVSPGRYRHKETQLALETPPALPVRGELGLTAGGFFGGTRIAPRAEVSVRVQDLFTGELRWDQTRARLPGGNFTVNSARLRLSYSFSPRAFAQALLQYNDRFDVWSTNLRVGWLRDANTGLYVVYNENRGLFADENADPLLRSDGPRDRRLVVKLSWLFDLLR